MPAVLIGAYELLSLDDHELAALGACFSCGLIPAHEFTFGISETSVILSSLAGNLYNNLSAALRTADAGFFIIRLGILTIGISGTCKEFSAGSVFDDHHTSTLLADFL